MARLYGPLHSPAFLALTPLAIIALQDGGYDGGGKGGGSDGGGGGGVTVVFVPEDVPVRVSELGVAVPVPPEVVLVLVVAVRFMFAGLGAFSPKPQDRYVAKIGKRSQLNGLG
ncbi:MAG TPA: hypothetical protein VEL47_03410 [Myxococcota bacterium]|nr:hypothetical protein [Myxococcota bacterium]